MMASPIAEHIKSQLTELNQAELTEIVQFAQHLLENVLDEDEEDLELSQETQDQLERFLRGEYKALDFDEAMKELGLDD
jgi:aspartyl/asparaginyl-tRNA synthetase